MGAKLEVGDAIRNANAGLRRFPVQFCLPIVVCGVVTWGLDALAHQLLGKAAVLWVGLLILAGCMVANFFAEVIVAGLYVQWRGGAAPTRAEANRVAHHDGLWWVMWGLLLRYVGWGAVVGMGAVVVGFAGLMAKAMFHVVAVRGNGIGAFASGWNATTLWVVGYEIALAAILSRYIFVVPLVAILKGDSGPDIIRDGETRTRAVTRTAVLLGIAEISLGVLMYLAERFLWSGLQPYHGARIWAELVSALLSGCYLSWFVLLRTELAMQLVKQFPFLSGQLVGTPLQKSVDEVA